MPSREQIVEQLEQWEREIRAEERRAMVAQFAAQMGGGQPSQAPSRFRERGTPRSTAPKPGDRAPWGVAPKALAEAAKRSGEAGVTVEDIVAASREMGHEVTSSAVRSLLANKKKRGEVEVGVNRRWHVKA